MMKNVDPDDAYSLEALPPRRRRQARWRRALWIAFGGAAAVALLGALGLFLFVASIAGDLPTKKSALARLGGSELATEVFDRRGRKIGEFARQRRYFVPVERMPSHVVQAFISAEDKSFRSHMGISLQAILRAAWANLRGQSLQQGASTITQQLVRMTLLHRRKTWARKLKEALLAVALEAQLSKNEIIELYLNHVFLGNHSYGVEAASRNYFRKHVWQLNIGEAALLAALPKAPSRLAPHRHPDRASRRQEIVLRRMFEGGQISESEMNGWLAKPVAVEKTAEVFSDRAPYFLQAVRRDMRRKFEFRDLRVSGFKVYTTLDLDIQQASAAALEQAIAEAKSRRARARRQDRDFAAGVSVRSSGSMQGAIASIDPRSGAVRAIQGGTSFATSQFDRTSGTKRRLGGLFAPFIVATALEKGVKLTAEVDVRPAKPRFGRSSRTQRSYSQTSQPSLYEALVRGNRLATAELFSNLGAGTVQEVTKKFGLAFKGEGHLAGFGYVDASVLDVATAYAVFANGGKRPTPYLIERIEDADGRVFFQHRTKKSPRQIVKRSTAVMMNHVLQDVLKMGAVGGSDQVRSDVAGIAAATNDLHNAWFAGSVPHLTTAVWMGAERGRMRMASNQVAASELAMQAWRRLMMGLPKKERLRPSSFPVSDRVSFARPPRALGPGGRPPMVPFVSGRSSRTVF